MSRRTVPVRKPLIHMPVMPAQDIQVCQSAASRFELVGRHVRSGDIPCHVGAPDALLCRRAAPGGSLGVHRRSTALCAGKRSALCSLKTEATLQLTGVHATASCTQLWHQGTAEKTVGCLLMRMHAQVISGPIASALLLADGAGGLKGWQWLFLIEGIPTIVLGFWVGNPLYTRVPWSSIMSP